MRYNCIKKWESKWHDIVEGIISDGTASTEDGKWRVLIDDLADMNDADSTFNAELICAMLSERVEVDFIEQIDDEYFIDFKPEYCITQRNALICDEIQCLQSSFIDQMIWSNAKTSEVICKIGELLEESNALTGNHEDLQYLSSDDGEWFRFVAGFVGDDSGTVDTNGTSLMIGDTVSFDSGFKRMIILNSSFKPMLSQEVILEKQAIKTADFTEIDIRTADSAAATVKLESCCESYRVQQEKGQRSAMSM